MEVCIKVQACGICHSDNITKQGLFPGIKYPRAPGHEVAGVVDEVGGGVISEWKSGQRSLLAGMVVIVAIVAIVNPADVGILLPVSMLKCLGFHMMAATQTI